MPKVKKTYRIDEETAGEIAAMAERDGVTATEVIEAAIRSYSSERCASSTAGDSEAVSALVGQLAVKDEQLARKDEQIARLTEAVADGARAVQGAQALHHETAQALAMESAEQKRRRPWWLRLGRISG